MNDFEYLEHQLDLLIGFLEVSGRKVYDKIKTHAPFSLGSTIEKLYDQNYENYVNHITTSSLLLGFSHFEDFITKTIKDLLIKYPEKNDYKVNLTTIKEKGDDLRLFLAEEQSRRLTFTEKIKFIEKNIIGLPQDILDELKLVNDIRNCLMHNNGIADKRLTSRYPLHQKIVLSSWDVTGFGIQARQLAREIWAKSGYYPLNQPDYGN